MEIKGSDEKLDGLKLKFDIAKTEIAKIFRKRFSKVTEVYLRGGSKFIDRE